MADRSLTGGQFSEEARRPGLGWCGHGSSPADAGERTGWELALGQT